MSDASRGRREQLWRQYGCRACVHFQAKTTSCAAFPDRIPIEVAGGQVDHLGPLKGDHGVQFEPRPEFPTETTP